MATMGGSSCHTQGMDSIFGLCLAERSTDPIAILDRMMALPFCHMHGPEHHVMVGAALLTAYKKCRGRRIARRPEIHSRGMAAPGGACGFWGACGAGISAGQFVAIATQSTPLAREPWGLSNQNDRPGAGVHRPGRRPLLLQTGQLAVHSGRRRLCPGTAGRRR